MKVFTKVALTLVIAANISLLGFIAQMGGLLQLPLMLMVIAYPIALVAALAWPIQYWKKNGWNSFAPLAILIVGGILLIPSYWTGHKLRDSIFWRHLPKYQAVVGRITDGTIPITNSFEVLQLSRSEAPRSYRVFVYRQTNDILAVVFLTGGAFPVKHSGYMYYSGDRVEKTSAARRAWPRGDMITNHWYEIGD